MKVFNGKQPAAVEVEAQRGKVEAERAVIRAQQNALEAQIADAYGTDTDTDVLAAQYAALEAKLTALALVERRLGEEHTSAVKRALLADYSAAVEGIAGHWRALPAAQAKREKAARVYFEALKAENAIRARLVEAGLGARRDDLRRRLVEAGLPASALDQDIQALEAQIADVNGAIIRFVNVDGSYK